MHLARRVPTHQGQWLAPRFRDLLHAGEVQLCMRTSPLLRPVEGRLHDVGEDQLRTRLATKPSVATNASRVMYMVTPSMTNVVGSCAEKHIQ